MRADLDRLMSEYHLDAIIILGDEAPNTYRDYMTHRAKANGTVIKKRGEETVFIVNSMEVDEAAKSGLKVYTQFDFDFTELFKEHGSDLERLRREIFFNYFRKLNITGRVGFFGVGDINTTLERILALQDSVFKVEVVVGGSAAELFNTAYQTKDSEEIESLKDAARLTAQVVRSTWTFIGEHRGGDIGSPVVDGRGDPLTIGAVKRFIRLQEVELGLDEPDGVIFAQGRDAGVPHSQGEDDQVLQVGRSIVFDIFPRGQKHGYFHDMTRTWCLGRAPDEVQAVYNDVQGVFQQVHDALKVGAPASKYQLMTLDFFEARGHPTQRSQPGTTSGYVHSLGHGLGLNVHEAPHLSEKSSDTLAPGNVFTVEPGLYYPDRGFGVRIEDTVYFDEAGNLHTLTDFPYDLVLPLKGTR